MKTEQPPLAGSLHACHNLPRFATKNHRSTLTRLLGVLLLSLLAMTTHAWAQLPIPASTQFDITGFIQEATLDSTCIANAHCGGTIKVNGHIVTVPKETIVILPANALTWQEIFSQAPSPYGPFAAGGPASGLALADVPAPMSTYEAHVIGNRVLGAAPNQYIAGLIYISQQDLNTGNGFINFINYATGEMRVGGNIGDSTTGTRVQINDPVGRYGRSMTPDQRFTVDPDNPTIASATGFPMCLPRVLADPALPGNPDDALCPQTQRPVAAPPAVGFATVIQMNDPVALAGVPPDATKQAPFKVGDWITFAGTLVHDGGNPTAGPWPAGGTASTHISAHTISNNVAIYTWPGTNPAYVATEVTLVGTGGLTVFGVGEAVVRTRFEGMTTDVDPTGAAQRKIHLYGIDLNPADGSSTDRDWGTIGVDPGPPNGAVKGRWRFRPPCLAFGTVPAKPDKDCVSNAAGTFLPPTREMRAVIEGAWTPGGPQTTYANGIIAGQYHAPILEYIFPENVPGAPIPPNNFNTMDFLAKGGYTSSAGTLVGILNPWPNDVVPQGQCNVAVASAGGPYSVASGGSVGLTASATGSTPVTFAWTAPAQGTLSSLTIANPVYTAPVVAVQTVVVLSVTATNCGGSSTASTTVTINAPASPTVNPVAPITVFSGAAGSFAVSGTDPGGLKLTFTATQAGAPALANLRVTSTGNFTGNIQFTAPVLPLNQTVPSVVTLGITAKNSAGVVSAPVFTTVTIKPLPDAIAIATAEYRIGKQRLIITANTNNPNATLTLQPYLTTTGVIYNPDPAVGGGGNVFTNLAGVLTLDIVGAPEPAVPPAKPLTVTSNLGGISPTSGLTKIRP